MQIALKSQYLQSKNDTFLKDKDTYMRLCQNVGTTFFYNLSSCYLFFCLRRFFLIHLVTSCYIPVVSGYK